LNGSRRAVVVFTKPPRPGEVKTRLIGAVSAAEAAELHRAFLADFCERLAGWDGTILMAWALRGEEAVPEGPFPGFAQVGNDLGQRLLHGLTRALSASTAAVAVGSDHPDLPRARLDEAFAELAQGADVVLGPADDGGYYLVGVKPSSLVPRLFEDVAWSSEAVLATTLERCRELGFSVGLLPMESDVDTPADLLRLAARLSDRQAGPACPATREVLERLGMWSGSAV
jgi:rSAM/selenodomain-associated transferase 1